MQRKTQLVSASTGRATAECDVTTPLRQLHHHAAIQVLRENR